MSSSTNQSPSELERAILTKLAEAHRIPRYEVVLMALEEEIRSGRIAPGAALPPETELASSLSVSRQTVRHALKVLTERGLLVRRRGIGTFVMGTAIEQPLGHLSSFIHTLSAKGDPPGAQLLGVRLTVDREASSLLRKSASGLVFEISRLFLVDDEPVVLERIFLTPETGQLLPGDRLANAVIDELLHEVAGINVDRGYEIVQIAHPTREEASMLTQRHTDPIFLITRTAFADDDPVQLRRSLMRGDRARFRVELKGVPLAPVAGGGSVTFGRDL